MPDIKYLTDTIVPQIRQLQNQRFYLPSYIMMMQCVEFLGAIIDKKPLKAREQSKKRFSLALKKLFDSPYHYYNRNNEIYDKLRNHLLHTFSIGNYFEIMPASEAGDNKHLTKSNDGRIILIAEEMLRDIEKAASRVTPVS